MAQQRTHSFLLFLLSQRGESSAFTHSGAASLGSYTFLPNPRLRAQAVLLLIGKKEKPSGRNGRRSCPPIIMGHLMGGLLTQILLDHGFGAAGVAIDSVPTEGIKAVPVSQIRALFPILKHPAHRMKAVGFTPEQFHHGFANTLSEEESQAAYERYYIPASGRPVWGGGSCQLHAWTPGCLRELQD